MSPALPYPASSSAVSHDLVQSSPLLTVTCCAAVILLLREGMSTWPTPGHPLGHQTAELAELPPHCPSVASQVAEYMHIHEYSRSVPRVAVKSCHNVSRPCPSLCTRPCLCHRVSAWLKQVCMQRATPQLSETEMSFDFHNPVASVRAGPLTHTCWQSKGAVSKQTEVLLCAALLTSIKNLIRLCIFTHIVVSPFEKSFSDAR